jgi:hypothetical protein
MVGTDNVSLVYRKRVIYYRAPKPHRYWES